MREQRTYFELGRIQSNGDWFWYALLLALLAVGIVWLYRRDTPGRPLWVRLALSALRIAAVLIVFGIFLDPQLRTEITVKRPSRILLLADTSLSMSLEDVELSSSSRISRHTQMQEAITDESFLRTIRDRNDVAVYSFGRVLERIKLFGRRGAAFATASSPEQEPVEEWTARLTPREDQSRLAEAVAGALREETDVPLAAVIVLSDGQMNAGGRVEGAIQSALRREVPIHTVRFGATSGHRNLRITDLVVPTRAFPGDEVRITASVSGTGIDPSQPVPVTVTVEDAANVKSPKQIYNERLAIPADGTALPIDVRYLPDAVGNWRIRVGTPDLEDEIRSDDNVALGNLEVIDRKTKVLMLASGPSREYQFLRNLLHRDKSVELSVLLQSALDPIAQDADHVLGQFPSTREELLQQDVLVAIDPDWADLQPAQRNLIVDWLAEQAGGMVLVAGPLHTPRLARDDTLDEIQQLYPVDLKPIFTSDLQPGSETEAWGVRLTRDGQSSELALLSDDRAQSQQAWQDFSGFYWCYPVTSVKPGATVLAEFTDPRSAVSGLAPPIFASQFFGAGRIFYLGSGEMWRLRRIGESFYERWWIRLIRQMAQGRLLRGSGRGSIVLDADRYLLGATIPLRATALDGEFKPLAVESLTLAVDRPSGGSDEVTLRAETERPGRFEGSLVAKNAGEYRLRLLLPDSDERIERRLLVTVPDLEFKDPRADQALLARLAGETGGKAITPDELTELAVTIDDRTEVSVFTGIPNSLWDRGWVIALMVLVLSAEWLLRKLYALS